MVVATGSKQDFEDYVCKAVKAGARTEFRENVWKRLAEGMHFVTGNFDDDAAFDQLEKHSRHPEIGNAAPAETGLSTCRSHRTTSPMCVTSCSVPAWHSLGREVGDA